MFCITGILYNIVVVNLVKWNQQLRLLYIIMALNKYITSAWTTFWTPSFWLPGNTTWDDFVDTPEVTYPKFNEICYPLAYSLIVFFIRFLIERYFEHSYLKFYILYFKDWWWFVYCLILTILFRFIFVPWGLSKGLKAKTKPVNINPLLEDIFRKNPKGNLSQKQLQGLAKQLDWSQRQVERWIHRRKQQNRPSGIRSLLLLIKNYS